MGVSLHVSYAYGFKWSFPENMTDDEKRDVVNTLYEEYANNDSIDIFTQFDRYYQSNDIYIGIRDKDKYMILCTCISCKEIDLKIKNDNIVAKSSFWDDFKDVIRGCDDYGFSKSDFYDDASYLSEQAWEIVRRDDINHETMQYIHDYDLYHLDEIYDFLSDVSKKNTIINENNNFINIDSIRNFDGSIINDDNDNYENKYYWAHIRYFSY
jgi:hypothetical protein